jgi:hypothetical protein
MSTNIKRFFFFVLLVPLLAACATARASTPPPSPIPAIDNPYTPQPGDDALTVDTVELVKVDVTKMESLPVQVGLTISYRLPTPCHQTRLVISPVGSDGRINIKMYSLFEMNKPCALMPLSTPLQATLNLGSLPAGHYTIWVNDSQAAEFDL